jgi:hypothetical protein
MFVREWRLVRLVRRMRMPSCGEGGRRRVIEEEEEEGEDEGR